MKSRLDSYFPLLGFFSNFYVQIIATKVEKIKHMRLGEAGEGERRKAREQYKKVSEDAQCFIATDSFHSTILSFLFMLHSWYLFVYKWECGAVWIDGCNKRILDKSSILAFIQ